MKANLEANMHGFGRELFSSIRANISSAEKGASIFELIGEEKA